MPKYLDAGVHGRVAVDPTIWGQKAKKISSLKKYSFQSDPIFRNRLVNMVVNRVMKDGKKSLPYQILYSAVKLI